MIPQIVSIGIIVTAGWMLTGDPAHRFHHAAPPAQTSPLVKSDSFIVAAQEMIALSETDQFKKTAAWINKLPKGNNHGK